MRVPGSLESDRTKLLLDEVRGLSQTGAPEAAALAEVVGEPADIVSNAVGGPRLDGGPYRDETGG